MGNKLALFALAGFLGGALGCLPNELWYDDKTSIGLTSAVVWLAIYGLLPGAGITLMMALTPQHLYLRKPIEQNRLRRVALLGATAGAIAFAQAQFFYSFELWGHQAFKHTIARTAVWSMREPSWVSPSLESCPVCHATATVGGFLGGMVGCALFLVLGELHFALWLMRALGTGVLGCGIGIALSLVERVTRRASVEVLWTPGQTSTITLGSDPITVGGGQDDLFIRGLPARFATLTRREDHVDSRESPTGNATALRDGARVKPGGSVELLIHLR